MSHKMLMCPADYFSVSYAINPWMQIGTVDKHKAKTQWQNLANSYKELGVKVEVIQPNASLPDMVFTTDQGVIQDDIVVLGRFRHEERQPESDVYREWFEEHGYKVLTTQQHHYLEGGECLRWNDQYFLGVGFRTEKETAVELQEMLDQKVTSLELINPHFYHLDTCFFPLNDEIAFYHEPAFSDEAKQVLKKNRGTLVPFSKEEAENFAANSIVIDETVITQKGNPHFKSQLKESGYEVIELDMSEFVKSGGGIHCLSLKL